MRSQTDEEELESSIEKSLTGTSWEELKEQRRTELELYKMISQDDIFRQAMQDTVKRILL